MAVQKRRRGNVAASARATIANVAEFGRAWEGGASRDIRQELAPRNSLPGVPVTQPIAPPARGFLKPALLLLVVVLLAGS